VDAKHAAGKLLSHRLRGFDSVEHSPSALRAACGSGVRYLEVDTRATRDGHIFIYHDRSTGADVNGRCRFDHATARDVSALRFVNGEPLLGLEDALAVFAERAGDDQRLCLDIKDYGFEREHLDAVREAGLEDRVVFVSWIPQTLRRLSAMGARCPLILSHWNVRHRGALGRAATRVAGRRIVAFGPYVLMGPRSIERPLGSLARGYQHCLVCRDVPAPLADLLAARGGGVCVPLWSLCTSLESYCARAGLEIWVFSAGDAAQFMRYATNAAVSVVFCDDARTVGRQLASGARERASGGGRSS